MSGQPQVRLMSSDKVEITTDKDIAERSILIKNMMEDIGDEAMNEAIPIPNVRRHLRAPLTVQH